MMPKLTNEQIMETIEVLSNSISINDAASKLKIGAQTVRDRIKIAKERKLLKGPAHTIDTFTKKVIDIIKKSPKTVSELSTMMSSDKDKITIVLNSIKEKGHNIYFRDNKFTIEKDIQASQNIIEIQISDDNTFTFGFTSDQHLCSKYERLDILNDLYDKFAENKIKHVFNAGNWIDGEARFNKFDIHTYGIDGQSQYLVDKYPSRPGITTYAISGSDHEGWVAAREGIDIGKYVSRKMSEFGRTDWFDLGFMESYCKLVNKKTKAETLMVVMHPGGGSAYAVSYAPQKIVESYDSGNKPAILIIGHYHKISYNVIRGVHTIQSGTTQDQTPFMRKQKIQAHLGGGICRIRQNPINGHVVSCQVEFFTYMNSTAGNGRWSLSGKVNNPVRW